MNFEKVIFAFFIILALSLNFGFYVGDINDPAHHHPYELFAALVVSIICTIMKFGDRTQFGSTMLASSLVADLQLAAAAVLWAYSTHISTSAVDSNIAVIVSLTGGALIANLVSVIMLITETIQIRK